MCVSPILLKVESRTFGTSRYIDAPCGSCVDCLKRRQNDWKLRIVHESNYWNRLYFFTLTYSNDSLPCRVDYIDLAYPDSRAVFYGSYNDCKAIVEDDMIIRSSACKDDVQRFLKRLRTNYERSHGHPLNMKYFICAEYGPNPSGTKRPHYHGVIMTNASYNDLLPEFNSWRDSYGRMEFKQVGVGREHSSKVANYISKYCAKGCFESRLADIKSGFIEPSWYIMSKNIGLRWLEDNKTQWLKYVPVSSQIKGDWTPEDVERFFSSRSEKSLLCAHELDTLLDNFFVMDGSSTFSYKMPRYYRERLLCVKKSFKNTSLKLSHGKLLPSITVCESFLQSSHSEKCGLSGRTPLALAYFPEPITYETVVREDVRYVAENFLSVAFAYRLYLRTFDLYKAKFDALKGSSSSLSDSEIDIRILRQRASAQLHRKQVSEASLRNFYETNMWNHREFDYESDGILDYNILN